MTRQVILAGYAVVALAAVTLQALALRGDRVATIGTALRTIRRHAPGRALALAGWLWLGWHLFVRARHG